MLPSEGTLATLAKHAREAVHAFGVHVGWLPDWLGFPECVS